MTHPQTPVAKIFLELAETLVSDYDLVDFLHLVSVHGVEALGVEAVGLLLAHNNGNLNVIASSCEKTPVPELLALQTGEGPVLECYRTGRQVTCADLSSRADRWPRFAPPALDAGFAAAYALPMRLPGAAIGAMSILTATRGDLDSGLLSVAQALTDVAAVGVLNAATDRRKEPPTRQLQTTLNNRVTIEQAKGVLAQRCGVSVGEAFELLYRYARARRQKLTDVAKAVIGNDPAIADLLSHARDAV